MAKLDTNKKLPIIKTKDLVVDYGLVKAIKGVNIDVYQGTIVAILGANGAGKSSLIKTISGLTKASEGEISYLGEKITNLKPHKIAKKGILQSPEGRLILAGLTVEENLMLGYYTISNKSDRKIEKEKLLEYVYKKFPILEERKKQSAITLSGGEQQMLAIGRALMGNPKVLLLDEPSLGLAPLIVQEIFNIINELKKDGKTILIVEQNAYQTLKIADYAYVLEVGKVKYEGKSEELINNKDLISAYLGGK